MQPTTQRRSSTYNVSVSRPKIYTNDLFSDSRWHGYQGPVRSLRLSRATTPGGGMIAKSEDGMRCAVAGRESLRILRLSEPDETQSSQHRPTVGRGGIETSRNLWEGSGLKVDSASTDVAWCSGAYNNKVLTSARSGELIMWDVCKSGSSKYERKTKNHVRSIHQLSCSSTVPYYCVTGSADGDMRVWDLRDMSRSLMKIHHPTSVRSLVFSPCLLYSLQAIVGLDNGSIYRWDLRVGQRGQLDRLPVAHTGAILSLDWCSTSGPRATTDEGSATLDRSWIVSGSLDHTVKVWELSSSSTRSHILTKPTYTLHPAYPVRRVLWRPDYPCELALVSNAEFGACDLVASPRLQNTSTAFIAAITSSTEAKEKSNKNNVTGDSIEIWDVRRGWIAKWTVDTSILEGAVTDAVFHDSHALWAQHSSGTFAQIDLRSSTRPIDAVSRVALSWGAGRGPDGTLMFVTDKRARWEVPYDDIHPDKRPLLSERKLKEKGLGDESRMPNKQSMGTYIRVQPSENVDYSTFSRLAKEYLIPDNLDQRKHVCAMNAKTATQAGDFRAAQVWLLLKSLLTDTIPETFTTSAPRKDSHPFPFFRSVSTPAVSSSSAAVYVPGSMSIPGSTRGILSDPTVSTQHARALFSPLHSPSQPRFPSSALHHKQGQHRSMATINSSCTPVFNGGRTPASQQQPSSELPHPTKAPPNSRSQTPTSSTTSSPRHHPAPLVSSPSHTPTAAVASTQSTPSPASKTAPSPTLAMTPRRPSVLGPTPPLSHAFSHIHAHPQSHVHARRPSVFSRSSVVPSIHSESPSVTSGGSLRHVGEGALDDSDSSDLGSDGEKSVDMDIAQNDRNRSPTTGEHFPENPPVRPAIGATRSLSLNRVGPVNPSPLSRLASQPMWPDSAVGMGEKKTLSGSDEDGSPSPGSTGSEGAPCGSDDDYDTRQHRKARARTGSMVKIRPRKASHVRHAKTRSRSSTVASLAAPLVLPTSATSSPAGSGIDLPTSSQVQQLDNTTTKVRRSSQSSAQTVVAPSLRGPDQDPATHLVDIAADETHLVLDSWNGMSEQQKLTVVEEEAKFRGAVWRALNDALEEFADHGDIQMCAMLSLFAAEELGLELVRIVQFTEAYIDMLMRYRLHTSAAYIRKHAQAEDIRKTTGLETTIYTSCGRCRKPITGVRTHGPISYGAHSLCTTCRAPVVHCAICHLPVRALLFQCSVCTHGGHQECYRRYYMERPMDPLSPPALSRGRQPHRSQDGTRNDIIGDEHSPGVAESKMEGHPCVAGCGHFCWVAVGRR